MGSRFQLGTAVELAAAALRPYAGGSAPDDSLRLQLPPLVFARGITLPDAGALRTLAALYLYAEHEQAGLIPVAEVLAGARDILPVRDVRAARKLEAFSIDSRQWYSRTQRNALFGRLFGSGPVAASGNADFQRLVAAFAMAVVAYASRAQWGAPSGFEDAHAAQAALDLLGNLGPRQFGNSLIAARTIHQQLMSAIGLLTDPGLQIAFQANGLWDLLAKILGAPFPDFGRLSHRGQTGQRMLEHLASELPLLARTPPRLSPINPESPVALWASVWLNATGLLPAPYSQGVRA